MIINFAQILLHKPFATPGIQNTVMGYTLTYYVVCEPFVQIWHNGQGHWLTVSNIGLQSSYINMIVMYSTLSSQAQDEICAFLHTNQEVTHVQFVDVGEQENDENEHMIVVSMVLHMRQVYVMGVMFLILSITAKKCDKT